MDALEKIHKKFLEDSKDNVIKRKRALFILGVNKDFVRKEVLKSFIEHGMFYGITREKVNEAILNAMVEKGMLDVVNRDKYKIKDCKEGD